MKNGEIIAPHQYFQRGFLIKEFIIAKGMIVPIVHRSNPAREISLKQLRLMYTGRISDRGKLGGRGAVGPTR